ncbi:MAG: hypothetical protein LBG95_01235 [Treponema sp.]|jgi:hypothetical protein|nr:hypothetical protein [Treponema sp.]
MIYPIYDEKAENALLILKKNENFFMAGNGRRDWQNRRLPPQLYFPFLFNTIGTGIG